MNATTMPQNRGDTLAALLARAVAARSDGAAVTEGARTLDWRAFAAASEALAAQLADHEVARDDRVALWLPNGVLYLVAIFAIARLGALAIHVNTRFGASEVGDLLARTAPGVLVTDASFAQVDDIWCAIDPAQRRSMRSVIGNGFMAPQLDRGTAPDIGQPDDPCLVYTTGGTTAKPKLVVHTQRSIATHAAAVMQRIGSDAPGAAYLAAVPLCGTFGNVGAMAAVAGGAHIVTQAVFDATAADALIRRHRITHALGDDRMVDRLAEAAAIPHTTLRFFGAAAFGADARPALSRGVAVGLHPHAIYGSSEVQALYAIGDAAGAGWGPVVPVDPAARFAIVADELHLTGPSRFDHYLDDPTATEVAVADGLFRTGDRAHVAADGFVFEGRMGDVLRLGGFLVSPLEIEAFLAAQPGVAETQVVGVEAARGTAAFAFAIPTADAAIDEAALIAAARAALARYKVPVRVVALAAFPVSIGPNGPKISRAELRRMATVEMQMPALERSIA